MPGLAGDVNDFLAWARAIASDGLGSAYDRPISFPPVLPWTWWLLGLVAPGLLSPVAGDPVALSLIKLPATAADLVMAAIVGWSLRLRPGWAVAATLAILLVPPTWYVSALWAQFESLYVLPMLMGWLLLTRGRPGWAAVAIGIGLMTKPQALPLAIPFAAYYLRRHGAPGSVRAGIVAAATAGVLWVPFLAADGLANYLGHLGTYTDQFAVLSLRAWNPWWILQDLAGGGQLIADTTAVLGPATFRWLGVATAGVLEAFIFLLVWRRPTAARLAWALGAAALAAFVGLTSMHERYAYPALVFLLLAWPDRLAIATWALLAITVTLNLIAAVPPSGGPGALIPVGGLLGIAGSVAMTVALAAAMLGLRRDTAAGSTEQA